MTQYWLLRSPQQRLALRISKPVIVRCIALTLFVMCVFIGYLSVGSSFISPVEVIHSLLFPSQSEHLFVIQILRMPRALLAIMSGGALGLAGVVLQTLVRNPLASPDVIGISDGAAVGAVVFFAFFSGSLALVWLPWFAISGALLCALCIFSLSRSQGLQPLRLLLIGIALAAAFKAMTTLVIVMSDLDTTVTIYLWLTGSVYGAQWSDVHGLLPWCCVLFPTVLVLSRQLSMFALRDEHSLTLGVSLERFRIVLLLCSIALVGAAVAYVGGVGFVGLMAPHLARGLVGTSLPGRMFASVLLGGTMVLVADGVGRTLFLPQDLPAGIFVAGVGGPFFIYLLLRSRKLA